MSRSALVAVLLMAGVVGCTDYGPDDRETSTLAFKAAALTACSGEATNPLTEITTVQVQVHPAADRPDIPVYDKHIGLGGASTLVAEDVPEGPDEQVTVFGWTGGAEPGWYGRKKHVVISKGENNPISLVLTRFGGFSCPQSDNEYTHRIFPTVTPLGGNYFLVAGGLSAVDTAGGTQFKTTDSSRKAFVYNASKGTLTRIPELMKRARGGHTAVLVRGVDVNRVILFGGTTVLQHNESNGTGFAWYYETAHALSTVEVFEYEVGGDPVAGKFRTLYKEDGDDSVEAGDAPIEDSRQTMPVKRVFPTADVISADGFVLVCGGGTWGLKDKDQAYKECDVWHTAQNQFLTDENGVSMSNNFMQQYRAGGSSAAFQQGEVTKLLFVGGVTEGSVFEVYRSSTQQKDGVGGSFTSTSVDGPPHTFFQSLTAIGDQRFVMLGGVNWNGKEFDGTSDQHAWLVSVKDNSGNYELQAEQLAGLGVGRYFHTAAAPGGGSFVVVGGFENNKLSSTSDIRHWQPGVGLVSPPAEGAFSARGAMASVLLDDDTVLMVGGINNIEDLKKDEAGAIEVYTPSSLRDTGEAN